MACQVFFNSMNVRKGQHYAYSTCPSVTTSMIKMITTLQTKRYDHLLTTLYNYIYSNTLLLITVVFCITLFECVKVAFDTFWIQVKKVGSNVLGFTLDVKVVDLMTPPTIVRMLLIVAVQEVDKHLLK